MLLMSDHGHYFGDHDLQGKPWGDLGQLYEPMVHQPFVLYHPEAQAGRTQALVQPVDVFPTMCELLGVKAPGGLQGTSFAPVLRGEKAGHRDYVISGRNLDDHWGTVPATVSDGEWSLVYWPNKDLAYKGQPVRQETYPCTGMPERRVDELFYLPDDPGQERNVLADNPEVARRLHKALLELVEETAEDAALAATYRAQPGGTA